MKYSSFSLKSIRYSKVVSGSIMKGTFKYNLRLQNWFVKWD